ncbi:hypothetical protein N8612_02740 [Verrucomicrobia bacterium]|nr:hypothetical protein [Verrucomicrobiota bacterium]
MNWFLIQNTIILGGGTVVLASCAALSVFLVSLCLPNRATQWIPVLAGVNLLLPQFLVIAVWMGWFGAAGVVGIGGGSWLYSLPGAILLLSLLLWPISYFCLRTRQAALMQSVLYLDPFVGGRAFLMLLWLHLKQPLLWGGLFVFGLAINNLAVPGILQVRVLAEEILVRFNTELDLLGVSQLGIPLAFAAILLSFFVYRQEHRREVFLTTFSPAFVRQRIGMIGMLVASIVSVVSFCFGIGLPLLHLILSSRTWMDLPATLQSSHRAVTYSVLFAVGAASFVVFLGACLHRIRMARLTWCLLIFPGTLLGAYIAGMNNWLYSLGGDLGWVIVVGALGLRYLGLGVSGAGLALRGTDQRLYEMAQLEKLGWREQFLYCFWPRSGMAFLSVWWLVYLLCLWEVEVLIFMIPPGVETLALRVFNLLHYGHNSQVNASCLLLILLGIAPWALWLVGNRLVNGIKRRQWIFGSLLVGIGVGVGCGGAAEETGLDSRFFSHVESVGFKGTGVGQFNKPRSIAVGANDEVFAVDMTGRVQRFSSQGEYIGFWQMPETERGRPKGMGTDSEGRIVVVEPHYARVNHFTPDGDLMLQWGQRGVNPGELAFPRAMGLHSSGDLFLTEFQQTERVQRFQADGGEFIGSFGQGGASVGDFNRAEGIGIDSEDRIYIADSCNHRVQVFDDRGSPLAQYGKAGSGLGELSYPYDVRIDSDGYQFVCEFGNSRIQVFDPSHQPVEIIGGPGSSLNEFSNPWSLALDGKGNLWVADSGNHRLKKLVRRTPQP